MTLLFILSNPPGSSTCVIALSPSVYHSKGSLHELTFFFRGAWTPLSSLPPLMAVSVSMWVCVCAHDEQRQATPVVRGREKWEGDYIIAVRPGFSLSDCRGLSPSLSLSVLFFPLYSHVFLLFPSLSLLTVLNVHSFPLVHAISRSSPTVSISLCPSLLLSFSLNRLPVNDFPKASCSGNRRFMSDRVCLRAIFRNLADTLVCGAGGGVPLGFLRRTAAGPAVRTLEDIGCSTKLFWQQCGQSIARSSSIPLSHRVTHLVTCSLSHLVLFGMPDESLFASFVVFTVTPPHPPLSSASSSPPYVIQSHLSLTCSLSHAHAQPRCFPTFLRPSADGAHPSSSRTHHFSSSSPSAYSEALLRDLIKAPCCSLSSSEFRI